ncbi:MAG TPA: hypothetical protein VK468_06560 [Pyrinomonadaceae bacterium]|nr:hypothetical protein [Pyrinomonadaceae bacterium]
MQETPKKPSEENHKSENDAEPDQPKRSYYYDDAHGYETFCDDDADEEDDEAANLPDPD